jgi:hypothetical protein
MRPSFRERGYTPEWDALAAPSSSDLPGAAVVGLLVSGEQPRLSIISCLSPTIPLGYSIPKNNGVWARSGLPISIYAAMQRMYCGASCTAP